MSHRNDGAVRFQMRQRLFSVGNDFTIRDGNGNDAFRVDGKVLHVRKTLRFESLDGTELLHIQGRMLRVRDTMVIEDPDGRNVATVRQALISPIRHRYDVTRSEGDGWKAVGNFLEHEYEIKQGRDRVAKVSKKWFRATDVYGVEIQAGIEPVLVLAATVVIDEMSHPAK